MKIIAYYLPQFHEIPENNKWWGKGFTEWENVKNAQKLFNDHNQPRVPKNGNYYNLDDINVMIKQAKLAQKYGIYGFCYYHYWFNGKKLLEKPLENMLKEPKVDIPFCLSWANETWTRTWADKNKEVLIKQEYGKKADWEKHFYYLLDYFMDDRYIKIDGSPLFIIYRPYNIPKLKEMINFWQELAVKTGLSKIKFAYQDRQYNHLIDENGYLFDFGIEYQPQIVMHEEQLKLHTRINRTFNVLADKLPFLRNKFTMMRLNYDTLWKNIITNEPRDEKMIPGAFVDWDNTPRYKNRGSICVNVTPEKFHSYLTKQIINAREKYKKEFIFLFAWNEWGEGGYLEPDEKYSFQMLEAIERALEETGELNAKNVHEKD